MPKRALLRPAKPGNAKFLGGPNCTDVCDKAEIKRNCLNVLNIVACSRHQRSCCSRKACTLTQSTPPPHPRKKREVQFVDHLNNALNNSTVIAAKKRATTGLEPDQQLARRNSKFSIRAAEKRSLHLHDKRDICAGARGLGRGSASLGRGGSTTHELGGPLSHCHQPAEHTTALSTAQHNTAQRTIVRAETDRAALETETQDFTCLCAK